MGVLDTYRIIFAIVAFGIVIKSLELIFISKYFSQRKPMDWNIVGLDRMFSSRFANLYGVLYSKKGMLLLNLILIASICFLFLFENRFVLLGLMVVVFLGQLLLNNRSGLGGDGSDQMSFLIILTLFLTLALVDSESIRVLGLIFITAQLLLSYFISGYFKLISKEWRSGIAFMGIISTNTYGIPVVGNFLYKHRYLSFIVCWGTILFEILFPLVLFVSPPLFFIAVGMGLLMHFFIGVLMGLNNFIWSFYAAYPALFYVYFNLM